MARRISLAALILAARLASAGTIANYTFDDDDLATGPDTFAVFEHAKGRVDVAYDIRHSGYASLAITDVAEDGDFPELQGYYPAVARGVLRFRFAMLVATPHEPLNVALAGPNHFSMQKDGIAFWLKSREGMLYQMSDSMPKKLFGLEPFVWYVFDVRYDVDAGTYDLTVKREQRDEPIIALKQQPNATSSARSAVSMFSFVGSVFEDDSNVRYYVDDIALATEDGAKANGFAAPGRRKLFIDRWRDLERANAARKPCPPVIDFEDVGGREHARANIAWLKSACARIDREPAVVLRELDAKWKTGTPACLDRPGTGRSACPPLAYQLASIVALTRLGRWDEAELRWASLGPALRNDLRYGMMAALLGTHRENWDDAESWLRAPAEEVAEGFKDGAVKALWRGDADAVARMQRELPRHWKARLERKLLAEEYYFVLLWKKEYARASAYAQRVAKRLDAVKVDPSWWRERAADAELLAGHHAAARKLYETARSPSNEWSVTEKLSDIAYLTGNAAEERRLREKLYGSLR